MRAKNIEIIKVQDLSEFGNDLNSVVKIIEDLIIEDKQIRVIKQHILISGQDDYNSRDYSLLNALLNDNIFDKLKDDFTKEIFIKLENNFDDKLFHKKIIFQKLNRFNKV